jgi:predicted glycosyltransferase
MLRAFIRAAAELAPRLGGTWLAVAGPLLAETEVEELDAEAGPAGVQFARSLRHLGNLAAGADAVVTMAGYNTACELMSCTTPAVIVPRSGPSAEQRLRARLLADRGRAAVLDIETLTPRVLAQAVERALGSPRVPPTKLDTRGIARTVDLLAAAAAGRLPGGRVHA